MENRGATELKAFGKKPFSAEFVRLGSDSELTEQFALWLDEGMGCCNGVTSARWFEDPRTRDGVSFLFPSPSPRTKGVLVGGMAPSADRFGRQFPFSLMTEVLPAVCDPEPSSLPVGSSRFLGECAAAHAAASAGSLAELLVGICTPETAEWPMGASALAEWCNEPEQLSELFVDLFPGRDADTAKADGARTVQILAEVVRGSLARRSGARTVRLPIGLETGTVAPAFWLEVIRRFGGPELRMPAAFWSGNASPGLFLVHVGPVTPYTFARIWGNLPADSGLIDLTLPVVPKEPPLQPLPSGAESVLADPASSAAAFLRELHL